MKKFRTKYEIEIEEIEVIKETEKQIIYINKYGRQERERKINLWTSWHETKEDAKNYLLYKKQTEIDSLLSRIEYLKDEREKIKKCK